jgi:S-(hydroxymethyl)glutathione dehydrogenase/alcohol dehydrogenase
MRMKAAILEELNAPLKVEEVELADPKDEEVLVRLVATGVCHSDVHVIKGDMGVPLPVVLGHEGAGIVEKVGRSVTEVKPGDRVVCSVTSYCGKCRSCLVGMPYTCERVPVTAMIYGSMADGTTRLRRKNGEELHHFLCQASFAEYAVVEEEAAVKVRDDAPLDVVCLLACGASTGIGAVVNKARIPAGSSVAVFGCGGIGLSAIMAAHLVGALRIFAVDLLDSKLEKARELGATDVINAAKEDAVAVIQAATGGWGADYGFEAIGKPDIITQAYNATRPGGMTVVLGIAPLGSTFTIEAWRFMGEMVLTGCAAGCLRPRYDIPRYVDLFMAGKLPLDKLVTARYPLKRINDAIRDTLEGKIIRGVITF